MKNGETSDEMRIIRPVYCHKIQKIAQKIIYMLANAHQKVYMLSNITYYYGKETRYIHRSGED